ncbi:UNVERIFIED_CONTAM: hypothetical protein GTU68_019193 [Idotea baltica]|nr:hypothetical protein [Idotea baltica]
MPAFPVAKLLGIVIKQMGKPLANFAKERAKNNHFFRTYVCMPPGQFYHWCEVRMKMYVMNIGKTADNSTIPKLNEQAAIELGASLLGEGVIFLIAASVLVFEYNRQKTNEKKKEDAEQDFLTNLDNRLNDLQFNNEELDTKIRELTRLLYALHSEKSKTTEKATQSSGVIENAIANVQSNMKKKA